MFPLKTLHTQRKIPYVNFLLLVGILTFFLIEITRHEPDLFIFKWSFLPLLFKQDQLYSYVLAGMALFIHTSVIQVVASLVFLKVFGDTVEDYLGHLLYLLLYLLGGAVAIFVQYSFVKHLNLPINGAGGAISAVLGFYLVYEFKSKLVVWFPVQSWKQTLQLPAWFYVCIWFFLYFLRNLGSISGIRYHVENFGFTALFGGLVFGIAIGLLLRPFLIRK